MLPFSLAVGDLVEVSVIYAKLGQLVENKIDYVIGGTPGAASSDDLLGAVGTAWSATFGPLTSNDAIFQQSRAQKITDVILQDGRPRRVRSQLQVKGPSSGGNTFSDGSAPTPHLPVDVTLSVQLQTNGKPRQFWGRKAHGPLPEALTGSNGELINKVALEPAIITFYTSSLVLGLGTMTAKAHVLPATLVAKTPLPHAALSSYALPIVNCDLGPFVGSQRTRRVSPNAILGH